jgi:hypothetical protein
MRVALIGLLVAGCAQAVTPAAGPDAAVPIRHSVPPELPTRPDAARPPLPPAADPPADEPDLHAEAREADPRSRTVKLKLLITPPATGAVLWGRKKLAALEPGQMAVEIERPRDTGPLDVLVRADGFLPHHVRLFTDRDDRLSVRLYRPDEARGLLGYRRAP